MSMQIEGTICFNGSCYYYPQFGPVSKEPGHQGIKDDGHNYPEMLLDVATVQNLHIASQQISDKATRAEVEKGIAAAVKAIERRGAAQKVKITLAE
jgi:hypothetical protein